MHIEPEQVVCDLKTNFFTVYKMGNAKDMPSRFWQRKFWQKKQRALRVVDVNGVIRFQSADAVAVLTDKASISSALNDLINSLSSWGDAGKSIPDIVVLTGVKIINLSGLMDAGQILSIAHAELELCPADDKIILIATRN